MKLKTVPTAYSIYQEGDNPIFGNSVIDVRVCDDAAGYYLEIHQCNDEHHGSIRLTFEEVAALFDLSNVIREQMPKVEE